MIFLRQAKKYKGNPGKERRDYDLYDRMFGGERQEPEIQQKPKKQKKFSIEELESKKVAADALSYLYNHLPLVGNAGFEKGTGSEGTTRVVFDYGGGKVIKFAYNDAGVASNNFEARLSTMGGEFITKVYYMSKDSRFLVSERVRPISNDEEFEQATGFSSELIAMLLSDREFLEMMVLEKDGFKEYYSLNDFSYKLLSDIVNFALSNRLIIGDTVNPKHWGVSDSGKLKLYDYGTDSDLFNLHLKVMNEDLYNRIHSNNEDSTSKYDIQRASETQGFNEDELEETSIGNEDGQSNNLFI